MIRSKTNLYVRSWIILALAVIMLVGGGIWWRRDHPSPPVKKSNQLVSKPPSSPSPTPSPNFNKQRYSVDESSSLWVIVDKGRQLPSNYAPSDLRSPHILLRLSSSSPEMQLRQEAASALEKMSEAAKTENIHLMLASGYRSYADQTAVHNGFVSSQGAAQADAYSARPGHSEHQTGLAADVEPDSRRCEIDPCFADTPEGRWLAANAYKYGFIVRYQKNQQQLTGYQYEPWHIRYVGADLAAQIHQTGQTLEQFFGLPAFTGYPAPPTQLKNQ